MSFLKLLNAQGIAGLAVTIALAILLLLQRGEVRKWQKQSAHFEQLYAHEQAALAGTVANYRAAADVARAADTANLQRVAAEQRAISERTSNDFEARLAAARTAAERLRRQAGGGAADPGTRGAASVPGLPAATVGVADTAAQNRLPQSDALTATEQAIQLDELIKWVRRQAAVDPDATVETRRQER